jgi:hypothetical protein
MVKKAIPTRKKLIYTDSPEIRSYYVNNVVVKSTPWDIEILLGRVKSVSDDAVHAEHQCQIYMSPEHALSLIFTVRTQLDRFEKKYGKLRTFGTVKTVLLTPRELAAASAPAEKK